MSKSKRERKPLIDEDGEVRELLLEDIRKFRPATEVLPSSLLAKLGIERPKADKPLPLETGSQSPLVRKQGEARKVPDHKPRMKGTGAKAARARKQSAAARKAQQARRRSSDPV